ncbi:3-deoxy-D-manno-octulosonic acid kinase [Pseudoalteromonas carrageenovora]|uniref:3-deoxy-D-manno-octulosonic acid kinase n=1 Tax=Pseudoalteromonas carrageenovora IAM 12662 TaxID=1314868 RepID=A0A2K4XBW0_PSEVC|nr:3-deoxy-D-manno-octulosonic acid kinase [Pseudoalteromonas carrageenovora]MBE0383524.1 3-deoxy-D-manno-octulosonic acid kinase [Pseudoalteromonas carrageenovora IAM 12662]QBJ72697.1 3-deoxy-D-manno-octulosonic acid kinase [Pseudoalteromonas carrageenovora]GEB71002.1 3-deoxy-D-manno-octulosonic acid kinase [Pseudoalteromonas carrageenovora]SOU41818.1 3-deoxy-D-manno-octulosonic acid kinase [Pseudoalteromonas carrageenovora IAM 12662]
MFKTRKQGKHTILSHPDYFNLVDINWFDAEYWQKKNKIVGAKKGRAIAWFFKHDDLTAVLRHYWRGGLVGKLLSDQYLYPGLENTRVYKEFSLMVKLIELGLNVPKPIAAKVSQSGLIYRGDIITQAVSGAKSLLDVLIERPLNSSELESIANTIALFHNKGVYHADLNINNILFNEKGDVYIIDFDRGELKAPNPQWQQRNMARLERSFLKEQGRNNVFNWQSNDWEALCTLYEKRLTA